MALSNILEPNNYNIYANSQTLNSVASQPVAGNNTLWINSSNGHIYRDGVDLEANSPPTTAQYFISGSCLAPSDEGNNSVQYDANNDAYFDIVLTNPGVSISSFNPVIGNISSNLVLSKIDFVYIVANDSGGGTTIECELSVIQYTNGSTNTSTPVPMTGTFSTAASANTYIIPFTIDNPVVLGANQKLNAAITVTNEGGGTTNINFYGMFCYFTVPS